VDELKKIKTFIKGIIKTEPAILADWLEDRFVPGTDEPYKQEALASLRHGYVCIDIYSTFYSGDSISRKWSEFNSRLYYYGTKPRHLDTREKLYMRSRGATTRWLFWFGVLLSEREVKTVNPLLFALACLAYGWTSIPGANRALACLRFEPL
jgi:hypothetical protein